MAMNGKGKNKGFTLLETLLYLAIFAIVGGSLFGILTSVVRVSTREMAGDEVASQLQFAMGSITRLVRDSSAVEMATSTATTTLKLRMSNAAQDPTCIFMVNGVLKIAQGPDSFQSQNCTSVTTDLTTNKVVVDSALFKRNELSGGHDQVAVDLQLSNTATGANRISRALRSGISRASAATFDSDLLPNIDAQYEVGSSIPGGKRWKNGSFSGNLTVSGNMGIGTMTPGYNLDVIGSIRGNSYFSSDGTAGMSTTLNVRKADNSGPCTVTVKNGLISATTCP
jgi:type II secretory pathway component PulJ